jgi:hypothetical protein
MTEPFAEINWNFKPLKEDFVLPAWEPAGKIHFLNTSCLTPECISHLAQIQLFPFSIQLFVEPPHGYNPIHIDGTIKGNTLPSINWDLTTDRQGHMKWYELKEGIEFPKVKLTSSGTPYIQFQEKDCNVTHEHYVKGPCLIHTGIPHSLRNLSDSPRYCLSIRFFNTVSFASVLSSLEEKNWLL